MQQIHTLLEMLDPIETQSGAENILLVLKPLYVEVKRVLEEMKVERGAGGNQLGLKAVRCWRFARRTARITSRSPMW